MSADVSQVRAFARDLGAAPAKVAVEVGRSVFRGATQIKATMQSDAQSSTHFKGIARDIDFDMVTERDGVAAEIGPRHGPGQAGNLANIAYFGNSRGAGGTVRDPQAALDEEAPKFEGAIEKILGDAL